jgi:hypothetical protein
MAGLLRAIASLACIDTHTSKDRKSAWAVPSIGCAYADHARHIHNFKSAVKCG